MKKCSKKEWCLLMERALEPEANSHKKGLSILVVTNILTNKDRVVGVVFKKAAADRGIMLNACPWCGEKILWEKDTDSPAEEKDGLVHALGELTKTGDLTPMLDAVGKRPKKTKITKPGKVQI